MNSIYQNNVMISQEQNQEYNNFREFSLLINEYAGTEEGKKVYETYYKPFLEYLEIYKSDKENPGNKKINNEVASLKNEIAGLKQLIIEKLK